MKEGIEMKKRLVFKKWIDTIVKMLFVLSTLLIITTIDSDWSIAYAMFLGINCVIALTSFHLLKKYSKSIDID